MDAEKIVEGLNGLTGYLPYAGRVAGSAAIQAAVTLIQQLTRPLTLDECRVVLNEHEYCFNGVWDESQPWEVIDGDPLGDLLFSRGYSLTLFEAQCLARGFLAQGGAA